jgi:hypothetical protein
MGSSGSSSFGDYKPSSKNRCEDSIDTDLEDVARSQFYQQKKTLPAKDVGVRVVESPQNGRLVVEETKTGMAIGNLPTRFNYLVVCMKSGHKYEGTVTVSRTSKVPVLEVHLDPA